MTDDKQSLLEAAEQIDAAAAASKCWPCGCLHHSLSAIERAFAAEPAPARLQAAIDAARERLVPVRYDCLGCPVCYPALAINALQAAKGGELPDVDICLPDRAEERPGWPPLAGNYIVLRHRAPVAVCTLTDNPLAPALKARAPIELAIVGTLQTENLGIERLVQNVLANPHLRFLILCGADSRQEVGHLPGDSLLALARASVDDRSRIIGARGRRPVLRNLSREAIEHFRRTVEVVDRVGVTDLASLVETVRKCAGRDPGPADPFAPERVVRPQAGYLPERMVSDPAGFFVVYVDRPRRLLSLEHYRRDGALDAVIEGETAAELYTPALDKGLVSRLDHAAYLGRELARAERALLSGEPYVQDAAPALSQEMTE